MKSIEPALNKIKENVKDKQEQAKQTMALYKERGINPFAGFFLLLIQFPVLIGLYNVFRSGLPTIHSDLLYSFIHAPVMLSMSVIGIDLLKRSIILAIIAVITQFIQINLSLPKTAPTPKDAKKTSFQNDFAKSMNFQMRYILPLIIFPIALFSAVIALYLTASNTFMIFQELFVKRNMAKKYAATAAAK